MGWTLGKPIQAPYHVLSLARASGSSWDLAGELAARTQDFKLLSEDERQFVEPKANSFPTLPFFRSPGDRMHFSDLVGSMTNVTRVQERLFAEYDEPMGDAAHRLDSMLIDPESGIPWNLARSDMGMFDLDALKSEESALRIEEYVERIFTDADMAIGVSERILQLSSFLYILSSDFVLHREGNAAWRERVLQHAGDQCSILCRLSGCIASAFLRDTRYGEHVRSTLAREGLAYPNAVVRVKVALAMLHMRDTQTSFLLADNWMKLKPHEQDRAIRMALGRPNDAMDVTCLPLVGRYIASARENPAEHDDGVVKRAERWIDLVEFRLAISDDSGLLQAAKEEWLRGIQASNERTSHMNITTNGISRDETILDSAIGVIQTALYILAKDVETTDDIRRLAVRVVSNELDRLAGGNRNDVFRDYEIHDALIRTIPSDNLYGAILPMMKSDDPATRIAAAKIVIESDPNGDEAREATDAVRSLFDREGIERLLNENTINHLLTGTFKTHLANNGLFEDLAVMRRLERMAIGVSPEAPHAELLYDTLIRFGLPETVCNFLGGVPSIDAICDAYEDFHHSISERMLQLARTATGGMRGRLHKLYAKILRTSRRYDMRLYASQGLALLGIYDHPEQQRFLKTSIEQHLAVLPKTMHRMYLFGHDDIESLPPEEMALVATAHEPDMVGRDEGFLIDVMLKNPEGSHAHRYARAALIYETISAFMYGHRLSKIGIRRDRNTAIAAYSEITEDVDSLVASITDSENTYSPYRQLAEFGRKFIEARKSLNKPE